MANFYYQAEFWEVIKTPHRGKIISEGWRQNGGEYDSLQECKADNPPGKFKMRFVKQYYEVLEEQEALV